MLHKKLFTGFKYFMKSDKSDKEKSWYAAQMTKVVVPPKTYLESFGTTKVKYTLVSEYMDDPNKTRVREGFVYSERPLIIESKKFDPSNLNGFGKNAKEYANVVVQMSDQPHALQYGLNFKKEEVRQYSLSQPIDTVIEDLAEEMPHRKELCALIVGDDELWDVSLLRFMVEYVEKSLPSNINDLHSDPRTASILNPEGALQDEIEQDFVSSVGNSELIRKLAVKLRKKGLFEKYEDRFYALLKGSNSLNSQ